MTGHVKLMLLNALCQMSIAPAAIAHYMLPFTMILLSQLFQKPCKHHKSCAAGLTVQVYRQLTVHGAFLQLRIQDAIKKTSKDELPDFYNIQLERPKDDAKGYDVLFIDAASKVACSHKHSTKHIFTAALGLAHLHDIHHDIVPTMLRVIPLPISIWLLIRQLTLQVCSVLRTALTALHVSVVCASQLQHLGWLARSTSCVYACIVQGCFASRISHSCSPNCQAQVMACDGRLMIALYTMRHVAYGEELTFDYASVTESEREFRAAICLCGTHLCR